MVLGLSFGWAHDGQGMRAFPSPFAERQELPNVMLADGSDTVHLAMLGADAPVILLRYLGYQCSHCVEQLTYFNAHATQLRAAGLQVLAFSSDGPDRIDRMMDRMGYDRSVLRVVSDADNHLARSLQALRTVNDTLFDLHMIMVVHRGRVVASAYTEQPYMDLEHVVSRAVRAAGATMETSAPLSITPYLEGRFTNTVIASPADGIVGPLDLDFNKSPLHPDDLWVVTTDNRGHGMAIVHHATDSVRRMIRLKKDSRASHFMWRTQAIAMSNNGTFATMQNGEAGDGDPFYQFMGPTLWSSDTAVFASRYQDERRILASHLDMLHQSPNGLGIAHERDNIYWVTDSYYGAVHRYDFRDPHEVGGTDHRDGIIRRYTEARIAKGERGRPAHIALDDEHRWLYVVDPGRNRLFRCDITTGSSVAPLVAPEESKENLAEFTEWTGMVQQELTTTGVKEPVGIAVAGKNLLVGDRTTGLIHIYDIGTANLQLRGTIATGATELLGITVGPDGLIWYVDRAAGTIHRLDVVERSSITASFDVQPMAVQDTVHFVYQPATTGSATGSATLLAVMQPVNLNDVGKSDTVAVVPLSMTSKENLPIAIPIALPDTTQCYTLRLVEVLNGSPTGVQASTIVVHQGLRKVVVEDALMEQFHIAETVEQTDRMNYAVLRSDVFVRIADRLPDLRVVLWNSGSHGELSVTDDAVVQSLLDRDVEVFLVADDPMLLRAQESGSDAFFARFGVLVKGAEEVADDTGQRIFTGIPGDSVSGGLSMVDCQLKRLDHRRGGLYIPNVLFEPIGTALATLFRYQKSTIGSVRFEEGYRRSVILGTNLASWLDGFQRTRFVDQALAWLEATPVKIIEDTTVSVTETTAAQLRLGLTLRGTALSTPVAVITGTAPHIDVALYAVTGQRLATLYTGPLDQEVEVPVDLAHVARGTHFVVVRSSTNVVHRTVVRQ